MSLEKFHQQVFKKYKKDCIKKLKSLVMKKILVIVLVAMSGLTSTYANKFSEYEVLNKVSDANNFKTMAKYLQIDEDQASQMKYIFRLTERKLNYAKVNGNEIAAEKALFFNLGNFKAILSEEQYRKYLIILNVSKYHLNNSNESEL